MLVCIGLLLQVSQAAAQSQRADFALAEVTSELGEPLQARLDLGALESQYDSVRVVLGSRGSFEEYGLVRYQMFDALSLGFSVGLQDEFIVTMGSDLPIYEPSLRLVLELYDDNGLQLLPVEVLIPTNDALGNERRLLLSRPNDTLWRIANRTREDEVSNAQQMLAVQRLNPAAFRSSNINGLRPWSMLTLPDYFEAQTASVPQALEEVIAQNQRWADGESSIKGSSAAGDGALGQVRITAADEESYPDPNEMFYESSLDSALDNISESVADSTADSVSDSAFDSAFDSAWESQGQGSSKLEGKETLPDLASEDVYAEESADSFDESSESYVDTLETLPSSLSKDDIESDEKSSTEEVIDAEVDPFDLEQMEAQIREEERGIFANLLKILSSPSSAGLMAGLVLFALVALLLIRRRAAEQEKKIDDVLSGNESEASPDHALDEDNHDLQGSPFPRLDLASSEKDDDDDAYTTRLKLAEAYVEMGDRDGAMDMLDEVISDGSEEQQEVARRIKARLENGDG